MNSKLSSAPSVTATHLPTNWLDLVGALLGREWFADNEHPVAPDLVFESLRKALADGSCVDAEGCLWNAEYGGARLTRYAPDGRVERTVELPVTNPTCCCFGGERFDTLFVVSATHELTPQQRTAEPWGGGLLAIDVGAHGLSEAMYRG